MREAAYTSYCYPSVSVADYQRVTPRNVKTPAIKGNSGMNIPKFPVVVVPTGEMNNYDVI